MKIEKLTTEQITKFPEYVRKWTNIGLSTEPANRPAAEAAINRMYTIAGIKEPKIVWCGSPLSQGLTRAILQKANKASVGDSVWDSVWASVWAYTSSLFPNIKKWKYIDHKEGYNPYQPCIDLWKRGFVPSYDGETWRLHAGEKAKIVYELEVKP